jgi:SAM-dependent methyltransferase
VRPASATVHTLTPPDSWREYTGKLKEDQIGVDWVAGRLEADTERKRVQFREGFEAFAARHELADWEGWYSPYDEETYLQVLQGIDKEDIVLDIGAGDLRLALRMAEQAQRVYAVEVNPLVVGAALRTIGFHLPRNLQVVCANALDFCMPAGISVGVLLMRHCQHFGQYLDRLCAAGCRRLLTNARWKDGVEAIDLTVTRLPFEQVHDGWYACRCGATGYVGSAVGVDTPPVEVTVCPACPEVG